MKPLIGITVERKHDADDARSQGKLELNGNYASAISDAGGIPLIIPPSADMEAVAKLIHGWLIPGGMDMDASHFGEPNHPSVELQDPIRYTAESRLLAAIHPALPVLGICYGCQFLNVARGGSLFQHLPDVPGRVTHTGSILQEYAIASDSKLGKVVGGARVAGKSSHHQAVNRVGDGLRVVAWNDDGTNEAIEATDHPWLVAVQWHPERTPDDDATRALFRSFVEAAAKYQESITAVPA